MKTRGNMTLERGLDILASRSYYPVIQKLDDRSIMIVVIKKYDMNSSDGKAKLSKEKSR